MTDSILRLLNSAEFDGIKLPFFSKAYLGIVEFCPRDCSDVFDHDNKGFKAVQNVLKGRLFPDDDRFESSGMRAPVISLYCRMMKPEYLRICGFRTN